MYQRWHLAGCDCVVPVGFNCSTVDLKLFKLAVTSIIPVDLNLVVALFDHSQALTLSFETAEKYIFNLV